DFAQSQSIPTVLSLYDRALRRIQGLFEGTDGAACRFEHFDRLTDVLVERANARNSARTSSARVGVGSVIVTGATAHVGRSDTGIAFDVHFFVHPTCAVGSVPHLFLWPREHWFEGRFETSERGDGRGYARVGRTAVVAPGGGKYFAVPRYDKD